MDDNSLIKGGQLCEEGADSRHYRAGTGEERKRILGQ